MQMSRSEKCNVTCSLLGSNHTNAFVNKQGDQKSYHDRWGRER